MEDSNIRQLIGDREIKSQRSFSIQTDKGIFQITEYVLSASLKSPDGIIMTGPNARLMVWVKDNKIADGSVPLFTKVFVHEGKASDLMFKTREAEEARTDLLNRFKSYYDIKHVANPIVL